MDLPSGLVRYVLNAYEIKQRVDKYVNDISNPESNLGRRRTRTNAEKKKKSALVCVDQRPKQACKAKLTPKSNFGVSHVF